MRGRSQSDAALLSRCTKKRREVDTGRPVVVPTRRPRDRLLANCAARVVPDDIAALREGQPVPHRKHDRLAWAACGALAVGRISRVHGSKKIANPGKVTLSC